MKPLKITCLLQDGRVGCTDPFLSLDSILASAWMRKYHQDAYYNASSHMLTEELILPELPFERRGKGEDWYWACSFNTIPPLCEYITYCHRRFDDDYERYIDFGKYHGKVNQKEGRYKAYRMPLVNLLFDRLEWYAVGDLNATQELCRAVSYIGKKSSQGHGAVDYWEVSLCQEDWSVARNGRLTRAIPAAEELPKGILPGKVAVRGIRSPYWHESSQRLCWVPENVNIPKKRV